MVNYYFDTFKHLKSFDIVPYQEMVDLYLKNHELLGQDKKNVGGYNERPINSSIDKIDKDGFWSGYPPAYFNIDPLGEKVTQAKADVISMDMVGVGKTWDDFIYLELPSWLFNKYQTAVHSNRDVTHFREFMCDVDKTNLTRDSVLKLRYKYDKKYKDIGMYVDYFGDFKDPAWRLDLDVSQYVSIKKDGLIYPIMFNSMNHAFTRGTHRALFLAHTGSDVPFVMQYPRDRTKWQIKLAENFDEKHVIMRVNLEEKSLKFYRDGEELT